MNIKVSKNSNKNWNNNAIQFCRLISELQIAGAFTESVLDSLTQEMDLNKTEVFDIVERATNEWDRIKELTVY